MPRVKIPRCARLLKVKLQGGTLGTHAPAKTVAVRKFSVGQGAVIQNKAAAYAHLQEGSKQKKPVTGTGLLRGLLVEQPGSFAAAPYLLKRSLNHGAAAASYVRPAPRPIPSPSFAARPVWTGISEAPQQSPEERRQAAIQARLAGTPLYTYAQLSSKQGVQKQRHSGNRRAPQASSDKQGLLWYDSLAQHSRRSAQRPAVEAGKQRLGLIWYGSLSKKAAVSAKHR